VVSDPSEGVVPDAVVEIRDTAKGTVQSAKTDRDGVYHFFFLTPSRYTLTVTHDRFRKVSRTVNVLLGPPGTLNVSLEIETSSTAIRVTGEAPLLEAENGDVHTATSTPSGSSRSATCGPRSRRPASAGRFSEG